MASREGSLRDLQAALDRRKFSTAKDEISPKGTFNTIYIDFQQIPIFFQLIIQRSESTPRSYNIWTYR